MFRVVSIHAAQEGCDSIYRGRINRLQASSRSPRGLRLEGGVFDYGDNVVSIHAAQEGCDCQTCCVLGGLCRFNSRSPSGLRRGGKTTNPLLERVSIHAAQAGCDVISSLFDSTKSVFQFTQPKRAATSLSVLASDSSKFQFTQPKRAATCFTTRKRIRIHSFNSRSPSGLRQVITVQTKYGKEFQFTQPKRATTVAAKIQQKRDSLKG